MSVFSRNSLITVKHLKPHMLHQFGAQISAPERLALLSRNDDSVCVCKVVHCSPLWSDTYVKTALFTQHLFGYNPPTFPVSHCSFLKLNIWAKQPVGDSGGYRVTQKWKKWKTPWDKELNSTFGGGEVIQKLYRNNFKPGESKISFTFPRFWGKFLYFVLHKYILSLYIEIDGSTQLCKRK